MNILFLFLGFILGYFFEIVLKRVINIYFLNLSVRERVLKAEKLLKDSY
jgi:hypothetical protein